jgi:hypothetical protein
MENRPKRRVVTADLLSGDVIIVFNDGKNAIYPASVLYEMLTSPTAQAKNSNTTKKQPSLFGTRRGCERCVLIRLLITS